MTDILLPLLFVGIGASIFPLIIYFRTRLVRKKIKSFETTGNINILMKDVIEGYKICPFGNPCLIYDENRTKEAFERVMKLMKKNITDSITKEENKDA